MESKLYEIVAPFTAGVGINGYNPAQHFEECINLKPTPVGLQALSSETLLDDQMDWPFPNYGLVGSRVYKGDRLNIWSGLYSNNAFTFTPIGLDRAEYSEAVSVNASQAYEITDILGNAFITNGNQFIFQHGAYKVTERLVPTSLCYHKDRLFIGGLVDKLSGGGTASFISGDWNLSRWTLLPTYGINHQVGYTKIAALRGHAFNLVAGGWYDFTVICEGITAGSCTLSIGNESFTISQNGRTTGRLCASQPLNDVIFTPTADFTGTIIGLTAEPIGLGGNSLFLEAFEIWKQRQESTLPSGITWGSNFVIEAAVGGEDKTSPFYLTLAMLGVFGFEKQKAVHEIYLSLVEKGLIDFKYFPQTSCIKKLEALNDNLLVYTDEAIYIMEEQPKKLLPYGIANNTAVASGLVQSKPAHAFMHKGKHLVVIPSDLGVMQLHVERLVDGWDSYTQAFWNPISQEFIFSNYSDLANLSLCMNSSGLYRRSRIYTGMFTVSGLLFVSAYQSNELLFNKYRFILGPLNFALQGLKTLQHLHVDADNLKNGSLVNCAFSKRSGDDVVYEYVREVSLSSTNEVTYTLTSNTFKIEVTGDTSSSLRIARVFTEIQACDRRGVRAWNVQNYL